jgi:hypothetical protein
MRRAAGIDMLAPSGVLRIRPFITRSSNEFINGNAEFPGLMRLSETLPTAVRSPFQQMCASEHLPLVIAALHQLFFEGDSGIASPVLHAAAAALPGGESEEMRNSVQDLLRLAGVLTPRADGNDFVEYVASCGIDVLESWRDLIRLGRPLLASGIGVIIEAITQDAKGLGIAPEEADGLLQMLTVLRHFLPDLLSPQNGWLIALIAWLLRTVEPRAVADAVDYLRAHQSQRDHERSMAYLRGLASSISSTNQLSIQVPVKRHGGTGTMRI